MTPVSLIFLSVPESSSTAAPWTRGKRERGAEGERLETAAATLASLVALFQNNDLGESKHRLL